MKRYCAHSHDTSECGRTTGGQCRRRNEEKKRDYYNADRYRVNRRRRAARRATLLSSVKQESGCVDCGATDDLEFDHVDPSTKSFKIAAGIHYLWERVLEEIAKCEVRCADCHQARHAKERDLAA